MLHSKAKAEQKIQAQQTQAITPSQSASHRETFRQVVENAQEHSYVNTTENNTIQPRNNTRQRPQTQHTTRKDVNETESNTIQPTTNIRPRTGNRSHRRRKAKTFTENAPQDVRKNDPTQNKHTTHQKQDKKYSKK